MKNRKPQIIILIFLLIMVIAQGIIILDYYLDTFSLGIFNENKENISYYKSFGEDIADKFIKPYRIIVKSGVSDIWIINKNDSIIYDNIFEDFKNTMKKVINISPSIKYEKIEWTNLYNEQGYTIEFKGKVPFEYLAYMLDEKQYINLNEDIYKIYIKPEQNDYVSIYIVTKDNVYAYREIKGDGYLLLENYNNLYSKLEDDSKYNNIKYNFYSKIIGNKKFSEIDINIDIPIVYDVATTVNKNLLDVSPLNIVSEYNELEGNLEIKEKVEQIKRKLLGSTYDKHKTILNANGDMFFINEYNIFSIYKNSIFKYKFTPSNNENEAGDIKSAFLNSIEILNNMFKLNEGVIPDLIISNVTKEKSYYTFSFDYTYNNMPIAIDGMKHAITISANETRVIEAHGKLYKITDLIEDKVYSFEYYTSFLKIINDEQLQLLHIDAKDINIGYIRGQSTSEFLKPILIIEKQDGSILTYQIKKVGE